MGAARARGRRRRQRRFLRRKKRRGFYFPSVWRCFSWLFFFSFGFSLGAQQRRVPKSGAAPLGLLWTARPSLVFSCALCMDAVNPWRVWYRPVNGAGWIVRLSVVLFCMARCLANYYYPCSFRRIVSSLSRLSLSLSLSVSACSPVLANHTAHRLLPFPFGQRHAVTVRVAGRRLCILGKRVSDMTKGCTGRKNAMAE